MQIQHYPNAYGQQMAQLFSKQGRSNPAMKRRVKDHKWSGVGYFGCKAKTK